MWPASFPLDEDGNYIDLPGNDNTNYNILYDLIDGAVVRQRKRDRVLANVYLEAKIIDGLSFRSSFSYDYDTVISELPRQGPTPVEITRQMYRTGERMLIHWIIC